MNRPLNVLVVEDSVTMAEFLVVSLGAADGLLSVTHVPSLSAAVARVAAGGVDVVLLDLTLPDAADIEAVEALGRLDAGLPIVVLSSLGPEIEERVLRAGAQEYLYKEGAVDPATLVRAMRHAVVRFETAQRFDTVSRSLDSTHAALADADRLEQAYHVRKDRKDPKQ